MPTIQDTIARSEPITTRLDPEEVLAHSLPHEPSSPDELAKRMACKAFAEQIQSARNAAVKKAEEQKEFNNEIFFALAITEFYSFITFLIQQELKIENSLVEMTLLGKNQSDQKSWEAYQESLDDINLHKPAPLTTLEQKEKAETLLNHIITLCDNAITLLKERNEKNWGGSTWAKGIDKQADTISTVTGDAMSTFCELNRINASPDAIRDFKREVKDAFIPRNLLTLSMEINKVLQPAPYPTAVPLPPPLNLNEGAVNSMMKKRFELNSDIILVAKAMQFLRKEIGAGAQDVLRKGKNFLKTCKEGLNEFNHRVFSFTDNSRNIENLERQKEHALEMKNKLQLQSSARPNGPRP